jgi:hypothetical protein
VCSLLRSILPYQSMHHTLTKNIQILSNSNFFRFFRFWTVAIHLLFDNLLSLLLDLSSRISHKDTTLTKLFLQVCDTKLFHYSPSKNLTVDINNAIQATTANNPIATITSLRIMVILLKIIWVSMRRKLSSDVLKCDK